MTQSLLLNMPTTDVYSICEAVDISLRDDSFMRKRAEFFEDEESAVLLDTFPKLTPLHRYISYVLYELVLNDESVDFEWFITPPYPDFKETLWVDSLLKQYGYEDNLRSYLAEGSAFSCISEYINELMIAGPLEDLLEEVSKHVFHILFADRKCLYHFNYRASFYVINDGKKHRPEFYTSNGVLKRGHIPEWAKKAVFHRDKGHCSQCKTDLTSLITLQNKLHFDHIIPLAAGGTNDVTNLQLLCSSCNSSKHKKIIPPSDSYETWYSYKE